MLAGVKDGVGYVLGDASARSDADKGGEGVAQTVGEMKQIARIMIEGPDRGQIEALAAELGQVLHEELS